MTFWDILLSVLLAVVSVAVMVVLGLVMVGIRDENDRLNREEEDE